MAKLIEAQHMPWVKGASPYLSLSTDGGTGRGPLVILSSTLCFAHPWLTRLMSALWAMGYGPRALGHGPWAMGYGLWAMGHGLGALTALVRRAASSSRAASCAAASSRKEAAIPVRACTTWMTACSRPAVTDSRLSATSPAELSSMLASAGTGAHPGTL